YTTAALLTTARDGLREIGFQNDLLREGYEFDDILAQDQPRKIDLAGFAQEPPSYRNACIGIAVSPYSNPETISRFRSLGAPQILTLHPNDEKILRWKIPAYGEPELLETIDPAFLRNVILAHRDEWNPEQVLRARSIRFSNDPVQLDFFDIGLVPVIEEIVYRKLDRLLRDTLASCKALYTERHLTGPDNKALFRLIFRLVAAKLLGDRKHPGNWLSDNVQEVIKEVEKFYFNNAISHTVLKDVEVQKLAWQKIRHAFSFQNLSVEALAYVYENTFVTFDIRKKQGIHATAHLIAEYVLQKLPIDKLARDERHIFEPFAGHAPFLTAALSRLRASLIPVDMSIEQRHDYFIRMLSGMEYDAFASEIALYSLIFTDYPNPNGWRIETANVFTSSKFNYYLSQAKIVVCNPPYENLTKDERQLVTPLYSVNKAVEALGRVLQQPPKMLGFVLPRTFIDGQMYAKVRKRIAELYNNVLLVALPDNAFTYSKAETVLLIAHSQRTDQPVWTSTFVKRADYKEFTLRGTTTWSMQAPTSFVVNQVNSSDPDFWYTPIHPVWDALAYLPRLEEVTDIHRGIEYKIPVRENEERLFSDVPREGFAKGLRNVPENFEPYVIEHSTNLNMDPDLMLYEAYKLPWDKPKVIANAARKSADRWLINGVVDKQGLVCYQRFHGIWPKGDLPIEVIAALLNGPVANAFLSTHRTSRDNKIEVMKNIPIPRFSLSQIRLIVSLVREYMSYREQQYAWFEQAAYFERRCRGIISQIDGELLTAYNLPFHLEQNLLEFFEGYKRPGPLSLTQIKASPTKRLYTSIIRIDDIRNEDGSWVIDAVIINWNPRQTVHIPMSLVPANLQEKLVPEAHLLAKVNVGAKQAEELIFEDFKLAREPKFYDELA
ncbi:MAG TPA: N-6 DNA methylase, partial [Methylomirabilota bacterium]|nr:N-6 DNA methylase [Methylomirabilota bacterium]